MLALKKRHALVAAAFVAVAFGSVFLVCTAPLERQSLDPVNSAPKSVIAPFDEALTFAKLRVGESAHSLLLVVGQTGTEVAGIDLGAWLGRDNPDVFDAMSVLGRRALVRLAEEQSDRARSYRRDRLLPAATASGHVAFGTNFAEHGEEVNNEGTFAFPKFAVPTASTTTLQADPTAVLLDYEAELCMRFDRDIRTLDDFDKAVKAVFLCGDFTDRAALLRGIPAGEDSLSGVGFSDAKSGPGLFPTGPYIVVPADWRSFVSSEVIATTLNGAPMQYAAGKEMILDFRQMAAFVVEAGGDERWRFEGQAVPLTVDGIIRKGAVLLSGTPAGVLFRPPETREIACGAIAYFCLGGFLSFASPRDYVIGRAIRRGLESESFLQAGDAVEHHSSRLGGISAQIIGPAPQRQ
ncbi:2-keto-4-pentenoate hydratase [Pelagibius litoralis]|uniref:2-keto-4-pentenoate hydratase n=1 Tax=Pelagibius litoralis TaxID=374515 RepID=A0A967F233_9PROT|nr:fumarylacetoacetate hydrolase family protein [Pelagibius litoralis]NIA71756.1 2-keto-4-pentenoate hydratase [Pelagibius litoralis]